MDAVFFPDGLFAKQKAGLWMQPDGLYCPAQIGMPWADDRGKLELDPDLEELIFELNWNPSAFTGYSCQGHFAAPLHGIFSEPTPVDVKDGQLVLHDSGELLSDFIDPAGAGYFYKPPTVSLGIRDDSKGRELWNALVQWSDRTGSYVQPRKSGLVAIHFVTQEVFGLTEQYRFSLEQVMRFDSDRRGRIESFLDAINQLPKAERKADRDSNDHELIEIRRFPKMTVPKEDFRFPSKSQAIPLPIGIYKSNTGSVVVHYPGFFEKNFGYMHKYDTLAKRIVDQGIGAAVLMDNQERDFHPYDETLYDDLRHVIEYVLKNSKGICGSKTPKLYLMGFSAGTSGICAVAQEYPVSKILLMGPGQALDSDSREIEGISKYHGELYLVQGERDQCRDFGDAIFRCAKNARVKKRVVVPGCDHYFRHEMNDKLYSNAPAWAFLGKDMLSADGGIRLVQK